MNWRIIIWSSTMASTALLVLADGEERTPATGASVAGETRPGNTEGVFLGPHCVWEDKAASDPRVVDAENFARAITNSAAWIRAVVQEEYIPKDLEARIVGVVDAIEGYDVTQVTFDTDRFQFLVTQKSRGITVVLVPKDQTNDKTLSTDELRAYLTQTLTTLFRHAKRIVFLSQIEETPFGLKMTRDENKYDENGVRLPYEERERISRLPQPEQSDVLHRLDRLRVQRLREIDPALPVEITGGTHKYWWGLAYAATDGRVVVFSAPKANGGPLLMADCKDWFRKDQLPRPAPRNPRKPYRPGSLWPPEEDYPQRTSP